MVEALLFSAQLRINDDIDKETLEAYVDEVMDLVELSSIRKIIVSATPKLQHSTFPACVTCSPASCRYSHSECAGLTSSDQR